MTYPQWPARRIFRALAVSLAMAGLLTGLGPAAASASACESWTGGQPPSPGTSTSELFSVAASSAGNAWAVGVFLNDPTLIQALAVHCC
jgi:hypothetical protein